MSKKNKHLTKEEHALIQKLGECYNEYRTLPRRDQNDLGSVGDINEFAAHIHVLQRSVMCRLAQRVHPKKYPRGRGQ